jgi:hypothetical protein
MKGIARFFKRVLKDITAGRNIDAYVVTAVAVTLAVIGVVDDVVPDSLKFAAILAALALLVLNTTAPETQVVDLDAVLLDRQSYGQLREFIQGAQTLWVYGPSAVNVLRSASDIRREVLDRGGTLRVLIQNPDSPLGMDVLVRQLDKYFDLADDIKSALRTLDNMHRQSPDAVEYGLVPYSPGFSLVIVDPDGRDGRLIVEFYGYQNEEITDRMHISIARQQSQYWFEYWAGQFELMWQARHDPRSAPASDA